MNLKVLTSIASTNSSVTWGDPTQQTTIIDTTNPLFPRAISISNNGVAMIRPGYAVGINIAVLAVAAATVEPNLTWPPIVTVAPPNWTGTYSNATTEAITATSEVTSITYQWQVSTDNGLSYSNLSNAGVYSNVTTATLGISDTTGLHGNKYLCVCTNASGSTTSAAGTLTVVPKITGQPPNRTVAHPTGTTFPITATGTATLTYQWQISSDSGTTWANQAATAIYTGVTTATLTITDSTGLTGKQYRCVVTDGNGQVTNTNAGTLTVT